VVAAVVLCGCSKQERTARALRRAEGSFVKGDYDKAQIEYIRILRRDRTNRLALGRLGTIYFEQGLHRQAAMLLAQAKAVSPDDQDIRLKLASIYVEAGRLTNALEEVFSVLDTNPTNAEAILMLADLTRSTNTVKAAQQRLEQLRGRNGDCAALKVAEAGLLLRQRQVDAAEGRLKEALALDSRSAAAHGLMAAVHLSRTNLDLAAASLRAAAELSPPRSVRQLQYIDFRYKTGATNEAAGLLEDLVKKVPDYLPALNYLADRQFAEQKPDATLRTVERILMRDPINYKAGVLRARIHLLKNQPAKAVADLERFSSVYERSGELRYQLGLAQLLNKQLAQAMTSLTQAIDLDPQAPEPALLLAQLQMGRNDFDAGIQTVSRLLRQRPQEPRARLLLARGYTAKGQLDDALAIYQEYTRDFPQDPQGPFLSGLALYGQRKVAEARQSFEQCLRVKPEYIPAVEQLVGLDLVATNFPSALERATRLVNARTNSPAAHLLLARVYLAQRDPARAEVELNRTIELAPEEGTAYMLLAQLYIFTKRQADALKQIEQLLNTKPDDTGALMMLGILESEAGRYTRARDAYEKLLSYRPGLPAALNNLAYLYAERLNEPDKAYKLARQARVLRENDPYVADTLGWILYRRGEYAEAWPLLEESAAKLPNQPEVQYHLGMMHYMMGNEEPARIALELAVKTTALYPGKDEAERCLAVLSLDTAKPVAELVSLLEKHVKEKPSDIICLTRLAGLHERTGNSDKAIETYQAALKINPKALTPNLRLASLYASKPGGQPKAIEYARKARELAPNDPVALHTLGRIVYQAGNHSWASSILQDAALHSPKDPEILCDYAWATFANGRLAEAETTMNKALEVNPTFSRAGQARVFVEVLGLARSPDKLASAGSRLEDALKADPGFAPALFASGLFHERSGRLREAQAAYEALLSRFPGFFPATRQLAFLVTNAGDNEQRAYELARKARESLPNDAELAKTLGKLAYQRKDYPFALSLLRDASRTMSNDSETLYWLGMSYLRQKQFKEARETLEKAIELAPSASYVTNAQRALKEIK
jgi:tetratricopeptide (TPR) repeat protein